MTKQTERVSGACVAMDVLPIIHQQRRIDSRTPFGAAKCVPTAALMATSLIERSQLQHASQYKRWS